MRPATISLTFAILLCFAFETSAAIVSSSSLGSVVAEFDANTDSSSSANDSATINALASGNNSFTQSDLEWSLDPVSESVSFSGSILEEKTVAARPGGDHCGIVTYEFDFTIDSIMDFTLNGNYGFDFGADPTSGTDDIFAYTLTGSSGTIVTGGGTGGTTTPFAESGTLLVGTYTLAFNLEVKETINNAGSRGGFFDGSLHLQRQIAPVPEPTSLSLVAIGIIGCLAYRPRRR